jgi:RecA/RadA recombinase
MEKLSTNCQSIDKLLGDGLPVHELVLVYGEASAGKTLFALQCAIEAARNHLRVFYVDSDQSFSARRLEQLPGGLDQAEHVIVFRPESFLDQSHIIENIEGMLTQTGALVIVDSITGLYRSVDDGSRNRIFARNRELNRQVAYLKDLAARFPLWVLLTGQVHNAPSGGQWIVEPVATRTLKHWSDLILWFRLTVRTNVRECILEKYNGEITRERILFQITEDGIEDL